MNAGDIKNLEAYWNCFLETLKGSILTDEEIGFQIAKKNSLYVVKVHKNIISLIEKGIRFPRLTFKNPSNFLGTVMDFIKILRISPRSGTIETSEDWGLFTIMMLHTRALKGLKDIRVVSMKNSLEAKLIEIIPQEIYSKIKDHCKIFYSNGSFVFKVDTIKSGTGKVPALKMIESSDRYQELIEKIRERFKEIKK